MAFGPMEIALVVVVIIILFGAAKIPELAHSLGKATGEFKKGQKEIERELADVEKTVKEAPSESRTSKIKKWRKTLVFQPKEKQKNNYSKKYRKKCPK